MSATRLTLCSILYLTLTAAPAMCLDDLILDGPSVVVYESGKHEYGEVRVLNGATLKIKIYSEEPNSLDIKCSTLTIDATSQIDGSGQGWSSADISNEAVISVEPGYGYWIEGTLKATKGSTWIGQVPSIHDLLNPNVDFNADGVVNETDLTMFMEYWHETVPLTAAEKS